MPSFQVVSDLHVDQHRYEHLAADADVLIIAGDWCEMGARGLGLRFLAQVLDEDPRPVLYVPGNHEFYEGGGVMMVRAHLAAAEERWPHLHVLDDGVWRQGSLSVIGSILWSDLVPAEGSDEAAFLGQLTQTISDFHTIHDEAGRLLTPATMRAWHGRCRTFLEQAIAAERAAGQTVVVVSHFPPSPRSCHPRWRGDELSPYFSCHGESLMAGVALWVHGHTHDPFDYDCAGTRVLCNPRGYGRRDHGFRPGLVVRV